MGNLWGGWQVNTGRLLRDNFNGIICVETRINRLLSSKTIQGKNPKSALSKRERFR